jgi:hypothetical protein
MYTVFVRMTILTPRVLGTKKKKKNMKLGSIRTSSSLSSRFLLSMVLVDCTSFVRNCSDTADQNGGSRALVEYSKSIM